MGNCTGINQKLNQISPDLNPFKALESFEGSKKEEENAEPE